jgi:hypothetical protein
MQMGFYRGRVMIMSHVRFFQYKQLYFQKAKLPVWVGEGGKGVSGTLVKKDS